MESEDDNAIWALLEQVLLEPRKREPVAAWTILAAALVRADDTALVVVERERPWLERLLGGRANLAVLGTQEPVDPILSRLAAECGEVVVEDAELDARCSEAPASVGGQARFRSAAVVPLLGAAGQRHGTLFITNREPRKFADEDLEILRVAAECISAHLDLRLISLRFAAASRRLRTEQQQQQGSEQQRRETSLLLVHDLKNPLAVITLAAEAARREATPQVQMLLATILETTEIAQHLVSDILDAQSAQRAALPFCLGPVDLRVLAERLIGRLDVLAGQSDHTLQLWCALPSPVVVADAFLLERVLRNLVDNALKYAPPSTRVLIRIVELGSRIALRVEDEGPAIDPVLRSVIFHQDTRILSAGRGSHGLGLTFCKAVADLHGAVIRVEDASRSGGNAFCLELARA